MRKPRRCLALPLPLGMRWCARRGSRPAIRWCCSAPGGVSLFALQFAKLHGARVISRRAATKSSTIARRLGADETVNYKIRPDWDQAVADLTGGRGADVVVGGWWRRNAGQSPWPPVRAAAPCRLISVLTGVAGAVNTACHPAAPCVRVQGIYVGSREMFEEMNRAIAQHGLRPWIGKSFGFDEARAAYDYLASSAHTGKVTIRA